MILPTLYEAKLLKRYKRFLVDINLNNEIVTAHCPNSGSMMGLLNDNSTVYISPQTKENNKLKYKLELIQGNNSLVGINTSLTNKLVLEALENKNIESLQDYRYIKPESSFNNSRFDFLLKDTTNNECYVEVKNVTLLRDNNVYAEFPDAKTSRGAKHLQDLIEAKKQGKRAINIYVVQINDIKTFKIAQDIDPTYYQYFKAAKDYNVEFLAYNCIVNLNEIKINQLINIEY